MPLLLREWENKGIHWWCFIRNRGTDWGSDHNPGSRTDRPGIAISSELWVGAMLYVVVEN